MNRAVFLDRDGTINVDTGYLHEVSDFRYIDGAVDGLRKLQSLGFLLVLITNQSGIGRGMFSENDYRRLDDWLKKDLLSKGVEISGSYFCPHHPEAMVEAYRKNCDCRKPACGLFYKASEELDIDINASIAIGDRERDLCICKETEAKGILFVQNEGITYDRTHDVVNSDRIRICTGWEEVCKTVAEEFI